MERVSLIAPTQRLSLELSSILKEIQSFTQKLPVEWEILLVSEPATENVLPTLPSSAHFSVRILQNDRPLGRSRSLKRALDTAGGDVIITFSLDMTLPLAEVFQFLQEFTCDPQLDLALGNRFTSRKKMLSQKKPWHQTLEKILTEKWHRTGPLQVTDPLNSYFGIRKSSWDQVKDQVSFHSWYFMPELLRQASRQNWKVIEVPVLSKDPKASSIPLWKEFWRAAFFR